MEKQHLQEKINKIFQWKCEGGWVQIAMQQQNPVLLSAVANAMLYNSN